MIQVGLQNNPEKDVEAIMAAFAFLPRHLARKHLQASMRRAIKNGIPVLKAVTPKRKSRVVFGKSSAGEYTAKRVSGGGLRRSVTTKAKYIGKSGAGSVYGVIGYRGGIESHKAIWLTEGTRYITPRAFFMQFQSQYNGPCLAKLKEEMATGLEKAAAELASGMNRGRA